MISAIIWGALILCVLVVAWVLALMVATRGRRWPASSAPPQRQPHQHQHGGVAHQDDGAVAHLSGGPG